MRNRALRTADAGHIPAVRDLARAFYWADPRQGPDWRVYAHFRGRPQGTRARKRARKRWAGGKPAARLRWPLARSASTNPPCRTRWWCRVRGEEMARHLGWADAAKHSLRRAPERTIEGSAGTPQPRLAGVPFRSRISTRPATASARRLKGRRSRWWEHAFP